MNWKEGMLAAAGAVGAIFTNLFGGWDSALITLILFMAVDYITGMIVAGVFHASPKTSGGTLESKTGWKGLCRKGVTLLFVLIACRLDLLIGSSYIRDAVVIAFILNESISITENAGLMGIPIPSVISRSIELLRKQPEEDKKQAPKKK